LYCQAIFVFKVGRFNFYHHRFVFVLVADSVADEAGQDMMEVAFYRADTGYFGKISFDHHLVSNDILGKNNFAISIHQEIRVGVLLGTRFKERDVIYPVALHSING
jgi:hypothetical protein